MSVERSALSVERSGAAGRAVFLSCAREDTAAAQRVADALRAGGVEAWFDQSELRGGDAWDAKIKGAAMGVRPRGQSADCKVRGER